ncbi:MAG TPA: hypothetical protein VFA97_12200 [Gaiellaceae bacterium]|nr:hypothetical protein [Gaiellaceae bacterium]
MPGWVWVLIAAAIVVILLAAASWRAMTHRRTTRLREQFGPEYDRTVDDAKSKRDAEADLQAREERRRGLEIRPLSQAARDRYVESWGNVQARFVDDPRGAVASADSLIQSVMSDRGYPVQDFEQRAADVSVDHPQVVENYRHGHRLATEIDSDTGDSTENLRQAMQHYRSLFEELVEPAADQPTRREQLDERGQVTSTQAGERRVPR